ncbi:MAG: septum formation initiator family protein [Verrucomicrobia bacterium]|nr:septum formation initiator family protein [Verrucomicrobiota bacterium]
MNVDLSIWGKLSRIVVFLLVVAGVLAVAVWYYPVIKHNERLRQENLKLDVQIQQEEETARQLKVSLDALRNDPKTVERLAREKLGYAKPGETVIRFEAPTTNVAGVRP